MTTRLYRDGTLTLTAGSTTVVGVGTAFSANVAIGDMLLLETGKCFEILSVDSDTSLKIVTAPDVSGSFNYVAMRFVNASQYRDLTVKIEQFLTDRSTSLTEFTAWVNGTVTGGPNNDGKYPLTDRFGTVVMCRCPALLDSVAADVLNQFDDLKTQVEELMANPSGYVLPKATTLVLGGVKIGTGLAIDADGVLTLATGGSGAWAASRTYNTATPVGTTAIETLTVNMTPTVAASGVVVVGERTSAIVNVASGKDWNSNGYPVTNESVMTTAGAGAIGKLVTHMVQMNITNSHVGAALGVEAVISSIDASTQIDGLVGFMWPNVRVVPNIGNVARICAFLNQDVESQIQNYGPYMNADLVELAPPPHVGLLAGRYYSAPYETLTTGQLVTGKVYLLPVHIPHRATISRLGVNVVSGFGQGVTLRMALYQTNMGQATGLKVQTTDMAVNAAGIINVPVSQRVDPGTYFLAIEVSAALTITFQTGANAAHGAQAGQIDPLATGSDLVTNFTAEDIAYGVLPAYLPWALTSKGPNRPHLWYQV